MSDYGDSDDAVSVYSVIEEEKEVRTTPKLDEKEDKEKSKDEKDLKSKLTPMNKYFKHAIIVNCSSDTPISYKVTDRF